MKSRWILFYDGACPLCIKTQFKLHNLISDNIKLTTVDLNSNIARFKGYDSNSIVLETPESTYFGYVAWLKLLAQTKYKWFTHVLLRPLFMLFYVIMKKRKLMLNKK